MSERIVDDAEARASLESISDVRRDLAGRLVTPWWYHPILGLLVAGLILCLASGSPMLIVAGALGFGLGAGLLIRAYQRLTGVWVSGFRAGRRGSALAGTLGLCVAFAAMWALYPPGDGDRLRLGIVAALFAFLATISLGRAFDRELRREIGGDG